MKHFPWNEITEIPWKLCTIIYKISVVPSGYFLYFDIINNTADNLYD